MHRMLHLCVCHVTDIGDSIRAKCLYNGDYLQLFSRVVYNSPYLHAQNVMSLGTSLNPSIPMLDLNHSRSTSTRETKAIGTLKSLFARDANRSKSGSSGSESRSSVCLNANILSFSFNGMGTFAFLSFSNSSCVKQYVSSDI